MQFLIFILAVAIPAALPANASAQAKPLQAATRPPRSIKSRPR